MLAQGAHDSHRGRQLAGVTLRVFALADGASASFTVPSVQGDIAARGTVVREGAHYTATVTEGALRSWCLDVDGRRSPVLAEGGRLRWSAETA